MSNVPTASAAPVGFLSSQPSKERRQRERLRLCLRAHIRPVDSEQEHLEEVTGTLDFSRNGLCFSTKLRHYCVGMALLVMVPYSPVAAILKKYQAEVVRIDSRPDGSQLVAVQFLYC
jgi:hypothetical protein